MKALILENKLNALISLFLLIIMLWCIWKAFTDKLSILDPESKKTYEKTNMFYVYASAVAGILLILSGMSITGSGKSLEEEILGDVGKQLHNNYGNNN